MGAILARVTIAFSTKWILVRIATNFTQIGGLDLRRNASKEIQRFVLINQKPILRWDTESEQPPIEGVLIGRRSTLVMPRNAVITTLV